MDHCRMRNGGALTDTAVTPYEDYTNGNMRLPMTKTDWDMQMSDLRNRLRLLCLGGVGKENLRQFKKGDGEQFPMCR